MNELERARFLLKVKHQTNSNPMNDSERKPLLHPLDDPHFDDVPHPTRSSRLDHQDKEKTSRFSKYFLSITGFCAYVFCLSLFALSAIVLVKIYLLRNNSGDVTSVMSFIQTNIDTPPILDIKLATNNTNCPNSYEMLTLATWPGVEEGCYCVDTATKNYTLSVGSCESNSSFFNGENSRYCSSISAHDPIALKYWAGNSFCVKYMNSATNDYNYTDQCATGYKSCGAFLCVRSSLDCPITSVTYSETNNTTLTANQSLLALHEGGYLILDSDYDETPLQTLQVEFNGAPCLVPEDHPVKSGDYYPLLSESPSGCGTYGTDNYSSQVLSLTEKQFYDDNGMASFIDLNTYGYSDYLSGSKAQLYSRSKVDFSDTTYCENIDPDYFSNAPSTVSKVLLLCEVIFIIIGALGLVTVMYLLCMKKGNRKTHIERIGKGIHWPLLLIVAAGLSLNFIAYFFGRTMFQDLESYQSFFNTLISKNCFKDLTLKNAVSSYNDIPESTRDIYPIIIASFGIQVVSGAFILLGFVYNLCTRDKRNKKK